jgi:hypothetical protein
MLASVLLMEISVNLLAFFMLLRCLVNWMTLGTLTAVKHHQVKAKWLFINMAPMRVTGVSHENLSAAAVSGKLQDYMSFSVV